VPEANVELVRRGCPAATNGELVALRDGQVVEIAAHENPAAALAAAREAGSAARRD
jgi:hypothetical protein